MNADPAPDAVAHAVQTVLGEYERQCAWIAELAAELDSARRRGTELGQALEALLAAAGPDAVRACAPRLAALPGVAPDCRHGPEHRPENRPRRAGRPAPDGRYAALMTLLADWPKATIGTAEITARLRALGHAVPTRYAANTLGALARHGALTPMGRGEYRIVRTSPELIKRSTP